MTIEAGSIPCSRLCASWMLRRREVSLDGAAHRVGHGVRVEEDAAADVARGAAGRLDERRLAAEEPFLVGVQDRDDRDLGQVEPFPQQVDADQAVEDAAPEVGQDADALERLDVRVEVAAPHAHLGEVLVSSSAIRLVSVVTRTRSFAAAAARTSAEQVVHLTLHGPHGDHRVEQARRPDHLLDDLASDARQLLGSGRRADTAIVCPRRVSNSS